MESPMACLDKALANPLEHGLDASAVPHLCALAARMVDVSTLLCDGHGHRSQLWLPAPMHGGGAGAGAGSSGASADQAESPVGWLAVCEDPAGWHVHSRSPTLPKSPLNARALRAVAPLLHRVAAVVCAASAVTGRPAPVESRDWLAAQMSAGHGDIGELEWETFAGSLAKAGRGVVFNSLLWHHGRWMCYAHADEPRVTPPQVSVGSAWLHESPYAAAASTSPAVGHCWCRISSCRCTGIRVPTLRSSLGASAIPHPLPPPSP